MADEWFYTEQRQRRGPVSEDDLRQLATWGQLKPTDLVWKKGMGSWQAVSDALIPTTSVDDEPPPIPPEERPVSGQRQAGPPAILVLAAVGFLAIIVALAALFPNTKDGSAPSPSGVSKTASDYSRDLRGKGQTDVVSMLGKPNSIFSHGTLKGGIDDEVWTYRNLVRHSATGTPQTINVHFQRGTVIQIEAE